MQTAPKSFEIIQQGPKQVKLAELKNVERCSVTMLNLFVWGVKTIIQNSGNQHWENHVLELNFIGKLRTLLL